MLGLGPPVGGETDTEPALIIDRSLGKADGACQTVPAQSVFGSSPSRGILKMTLSVQRTAPVKPGVARPEVMT